MELSLFGRRVSYVDQGSGPVVLFLHGWGAPVSTYRLLTDHLSGCCRVVAPDLPGFGDSEEPEEPWTVDRYADFVLAFARALDLQEVTLMGHSFGGRIIIKLFSRPDCFLTVKKAVLLDAAGIKPRHGLRYYLRVGTYKAAKRVASLPGIRTLFPGAVERAQKAFGSSDYRNASPIMRRTMVQCIQEDLTPLLPRITASTLLIWGDKDTATPLSDGKRMERDIPDAGLVVLDGGHFAFAEQWNLCRRVLDVFLIPKEEPPHA